MIVNSRDVKFITISIKRVLRLRLNINGKGETYRKKKVTINELVSF